MKMDAKTVYNDWKSGVLSGNTNSVPAGVWAVGRSQEHMGVLIAMQANIIQDTDAHSYFNK